MLDLGLRVKRLHHMSSSRERGRFLREGGGSRREERLDGVQIRFLPGCHDRCPNTCIGVICEQGKLKSKVQRVLLEFRLLQQK